MTKAAQRRVVRLGFRPNKIVGAHHLNRVREGCDQFACREVLFDQIIGQQRNAETVNRCLIDRCVLIVNRYVQCVGMAGPHMTEPFLPGVGPGMDVQQW